MAEELSKTEIERLIRRSAASRSCLTDEFTALRYRINVPARLLGSMKSHPTGWLLGALTSGFVVSRFFRRKPARHAGVPRGLPLTILGIAIAAAKPALKFWLGGQLKRYLARLSAPDHTRPLQ